MTLSAIVLALMTCTAAPPYDDCGPVLAEVRRNPETRLIAENLDAALADPRLARHILSTHDGFFGVAP